MTSSFLSLFISFAFYRAHETENVRKNRLANDNAAQKTKYASLSPNSKRLRNQKRTENRRLKKVTKILDVKENVDSKVDNIGHVWEIAIKPVMMEV